MKKLTTVVTMALIFTGMVRGADRSEEGIPTSPLKIYSGGFGIGALMSLNEELQDVSRQFFRLSMVNTFTVRDNLALFLDVQNVTNRLNAEGVERPEELEVLRDIGIVERFLLDKPQQIEPHGRSS